MCCSDKLFYYFSPQGNGTFSHRSGQEVEMLLSDDLVVTVYAESQHHPLPSLTGSSYIHRTSIPEDTTVSHFDN